MTAWWRRRWGLVVVYTDPQAGQQHRNRMPRRYWTEAGARRHCGSAWPGVDSRPNLRVEVAQLGADEDDGWRPL